MSKSERKLKRNKLRAEVGNKELRKVWVNKKIQLLLTERKEIVKAVKLMRKNVGVGANVSEYNMRKVAIDKDLTKSGYRFKKTVMGG